MKDYEADERRYKADDAMRTIARAEEHKKDKQLMADVKKQHAAMGKALGPMGAAGGNGGPDRKAPSKPKNPLSAQKTASPALKADLSRGTKPQKPVAMPAAKKKQRA